MSWAEWWMFYATVLLPATVGGFICLAVGYCLGYRRGKIAVRDAFVEYPGFPNTYAVSVEMKPKKENPLPFDWGFGDKR